MSRANFPAPGVSRRPPDHRLCGIGAALAKLEVPTNDGAFDDLLRQLEAIVPTPLAEAAKLASPLADAPARELWARRLRRGILTCAAGRGVGRRRGAA